MRKGTCKFHIGHHHNTHCAAGVEYKSVLSDPDRLHGSAYRYPCVQDWSFCTSPLTDSQQAEFQKRGTCPKFTEPTAEEIKTARAKHDAAMKRFMLTLPLINRIKSDHRGQNWKGVETCPACKGKLHVGHAAYNGHVRGKCETDGCLSWME